MRTAVAVGLTAFAFVLAVRGGPYLGHTPSGWLLPADFVLHGLSLIAVNVTIYCYLCWVGFWFIRGTKGWERLFLLGWFVGIVLSPLKMLRPQWAGAIQHIGTFGLALALVAALSLLWRSLDEADSTGGTDAT